LQRGSDFWHDFFMRKTKYLEDRYRFPGFRPRRETGGIFGDPSARIVALRRREKKPSAASAVRFIGRATIMSSSKSETFPAATRASTWNWKSGASSAGSAGQ
jgi:hypothetical protein